MKHQLPRSAHLDLVAGLSLLLALTGGMTLLIWRINNPSFVNHPATPSQIAQPTDDGTKAAPPAISRSALPNLNPSGDKPVSKSASQVYMLQAKGNQLEMVPIATSRSEPSRSETAVLTATINYLLANPQLANLSSAIPPGTRLLNLQIKPEGIHLNLSQEFTRGGGSTSMTYRVAQVLYTATSLEPTAKVYLAVEGKLLDQDNPLGGEGIILQQPLTRQQLIYDFSIEE